MVLQACALIADDDPDFRLLTTVLLNKYGLKTQEAVDGEDALKKIHRNSFDVMILDITMPNLDGLGVMRELKFEGIELPTIIVTSEEDEQLHQKAIGLGASRFLNKPIKPQELIENINHLIQQEL